MVFPQSATAFDNQLATKEAGRQTLLSCLIFIVIGTVTTLLGPLLPFLPARFSITPAQAGQLFFWQFLASIAATLTAGMVLKRAGFRGLVTIALALSLAGVSGLHTSDWLIARCTVACYGLGLGLAIPAINITVSKINPTRRASMLSVLNAGWVLGALAGPMLLFAVGTPGTFLTVVQLALALAMVAAMIFAAASPGGAQPEQETRPDSQAKTITTFALLMFLVVGVENSMSGWASSIAVRHFSNPVRASLATAAFWSLYLCSRAVMPLILKRITDEEFLTGSLLFAMAGIAVFYAGTNAAAALAGCGIAGFGAGALFPLVVARMTKEMGTGNPVVMVCFACSGFGGALLPLLTGKLQAALGAAKYGLAVPFLALGSAMILFRIHAAAPRAAEYRSV